MMRKIQDFLETSSTTAWEHGAKMQSNRHVCEVTSRYLVLKRRNALNAINFEALRHHWFSRPPALCNVCAIFLHIIDCSFLNLLQPHCWPVPPPWLHSQDWASLRGGDQVQFVCQCPSQKLLPLACMQLVCGVSVRPTDICSFRKNKKFAVCKHLIHSVDIASSLTRNYSRTLKLWNHNRNHNWSHLLLVSVVSGEGCSLFLISSKIIN